MRLVNVMNEYNVWERLPYWTVKKESSDKAYEYVVSSTFNQYLRILNDIKSFYYCVWLFVGRLVYIS